MSDKTSQRTEEEMLDQTFGGYDEEMTAQTTEPQTTAPTKKDKKDNTNKYLMIGGGVACVLAAGYMLLGKSPEQVNSAPVAATPVTPAPVQQAPVTPVATPSPEVANNVNQSVTETTPVNPLAQNNQVKPEDSVNPVNPLANSNAVVNQAPVEVKETPVVPAQQTPVAEVKVDVKPVTPMPNNVASINSVNAVNNPSVGNNLVQQELVNQLKQMFDQQTKEIKSSVDQVGGRVTDLEKANKSIEERLARLEAGKSTKVVSVNDGETKAKPVAKKKPAYKSVTVTKKPVVSKENGSNLLVDKSNIADKVDKGSEKTTIPVVSAQEVKIHSVFAGRVWTKNKDGSLSTFTEGESLPSGEVIKRIDNEKQEVVTNRRVIK